MSSERIAGHALSWAAAQFRDRPAVVFRDRSFSYTQIERRSNQLANALIGLGLQPGRTARGAAQQLGAQHREPVRRREGGAGLRRAERAPHPARAGRRSSTTPRRRCSSPAPSFATSALQVRALVPSLRHVIGVGWHDDGVLAYDDPAGAAADRAPWLKVPRRPAAAHRLHLGHHRPAQGRGLQHRTLGGAPGEPLRRHGVRPGHRRRDAARGSAHARGRRAPAAVLPARRAQHRGRPLRSRAGAGADRQRPHHAS